jgi:hypothetical protein
MKETYSRNLYLTDVYSPFYISSYALHQFNLHNIKTPNHVLWQAKEVPNMRLHLIMVAPPGFMKTHYLKAFAGTSYSIFTNTNVPIAHRQNMNEASFVGTFQQRGDRVTERDGIARTFSEGIVAIDEFDAINNAMKSSYNNQFETQLLAALDHGEIFKDMASDSFGYTTYLTMWGGIQPTRFDMSAGLGRRFCYMVFVPSPEDNAALRNTIHGSYNMQVNMHDLNDLHYKIKEFNASIKKIKRVHMDDSLNEFYEKENLFCHESTNFNKIAIGYNIAKYGAEQEVTIGIFDEQLKRILRQEKAWRDDIQQGIDFRMIVMLLGRHGGEASAQTIITDCMMYGWNASIVGTIIKNMVDAGYLVRRGGVVKLQL